jgi:peptidoglycan/LPS O-acetylase OafA/YrhL
METPLYWMVGYPLLIAFSGVLGFLYSSRAWRWGIWMMAGQILPAIFNPTSDLNLLPFGLFVLFILAVPLIVVAEVAARFGRNRVAKTSND